MKTVKDLIAYEMLGTWWVYYIFWNKGQKWAVKYFQRKVYRKLKTYKKHTNIYNEKHK